MGSLAASRQPGFLVALQTHRAPQNREGHPTEQTRRPWIHPPRPLHLIPGGIDRKGRDATWRSSGRAGVGHRGGRVHRLAPGRALVVEGRAVRVVDNLVTGHRSNLAHLEGKFEWLEGDLADFEVCRAAVEGVTEVLHQAQSPASLGRSWSRSSRTPAGRPRPSTFWRPPGSPAPVASSSPPRAAPTATPTTCPSTKRWSPTPSALRRRQARGRALRPRLRQDDGARRRQPPLLQRLRAQARPVQPL